MIFKFVIKCELALAELQNTKSRNHYLKNLMHHVNSTEMPS